LSLSSDVARGVDHSVWLGVTLVADGLEGGAVLDTLRGGADPSVVRALVQGTILIYNGSIAFAITGLFLGAAGWATFDSGVLPRWTGWIAFREAYNAEQGSSERYDQIRSMVETGPLIETNTSG
jgi:hypothetical protein